LESHEHFLYILRCSKFWSRILHILWNACGNNFSASASAGTSAGTCRNTGYRDCVVQP
jgi:hypothetical protein